jgi:D-alanine-D-alanine ligase-like ATP-grasp enzyme
MAGNKPLVYSILKQHSLATSQYVEFELANIDKAIDLFKQIENPLVVKPAYGGAAGKGVTTGIVSEKSLRKASRLASTYCRQLIAEEQVSGHSYRLLFLEGEFIDAVRRDPPSVVGDGIHNLKELIDIENRKRASENQPKAVNPLFVDLECKQWLKEQGLNLNHIPATGSKVEVKRVVNQNNSDDNHVVRDEVCDEIIKQCQKVISYMGIALAGVDIIAERLDIPLKESGGIINEINTTPGLHHHVLVSNEKDAFPIFEHLLEYLLSTNFHKNYSCPLEKDTSL